jgi:predicted nucleic acid-binding Zn ribbon protein
MEGVERPESEHILILRDAWVKLVGTQIAKHSTPGFIKDWALHVRVDHPGWIPEMKRNSSIILSKLKANYPSLSIRRLIFILS